MGNFINIIFLSLFCLSKLATCLSEKFDNSTIQFSWKCENQKCMKEIVQYQSNKQGITPFEVCKLFCGSSILWPLPTTYSLSNFPVYIKSISVKHTPLGTGLPEKLQHLLEGAENVFHERIKSEMNKTPPLNENGEYELQVMLEINDTSSQTLTLQTDESYSLNIQEIDNVMLASIKGETYYGVRNGLETLAQLIVYDTVRNKLIMPNYVKITDKPEYPYRGLMLDTSRNYISVEGIKRTINVMAANKLNTFHWHLTDSQSFPVLLNGFKQFAEYGAYSAEKVYTEKDIRAIVEYASFHGVRVVPELDAPAHTGEGWQWAPQDTILCFNKEPWQSYCFEPPCGQLNPLGEYTYEILGEIYINYNRLFKSDIFHMGGDEVHFGCWDTSEDIKKWIDTNYPTNSTLDANNKKPDETRQINEKGNYSKKGYFALWYKFQEAALQKLKEAHQYEINQPEVVLWSSELTKGENLNNYFNNTNYIIQVWTRNNDPIFSELLENNFRIIVSNYDGLYLDSGFGSWVTDYSDSIYRAWHRVYENILPIIETLSEEKRHLILGQEAALWTEIASEESLDSRLWPRAAALAERTWSNPKTTWRDAESRMLYHRDRLIRLGVKADSIEPEWCNINRSGCS